MVSPAKALKPLYRLRPGEKRSKLSAGLAAGPCPHAAGAAPWMICWSACATCAPG